MIAEPFTPPIAETGCDDAVLVARAQSDPAAFAPLYDRYFDRIYRFCYHRLGGWDAAEDATSLVFAKALAALPTCRPDAFRSWLFAIAHHVVTDRFRQARPTQPLTTIAEVADASPTPEDAAIAADERRSLHVLLARLPTDQRRALELRLAGLTGAETAEVLGRSHTAVRLLQFRAVARLRALLAEGPDRKEAPDGQG